MAKSVFTLEQIRKSPAAKLNAHLFAEPHNSAQNVKKTQQDKPKALQKMEEVLQNHGIVYQTEYKFVENRRFRFDIAVPELKVAFEYEGLMSKKSRHTTLTGYTKDATKYNLAQADGWRVFRYTVLNHTEIENDLLKILNKIS